MSKHAKEIETYHATALQSKSSLTVTEICKIHESKDIRKELLTTIDY